MIIKILTLLLLAVFYSCYFAKMYEQRKKGISTDQLGKGKSGKEKYIEIMLKLVTYIMPAVEIFSIFLSHSTLSVYYRATGVLITLSGIIFFILSVIHMKDNWRAGVQSKEKTELVTEGIYSISRNPAFAGFLLMYYGILLSFFSWILLAFTAIATVLFHLQIVAVEEKFLKESFGVDYEEYRNRVCRYLGRK